MSDIRLTWDYDCGAADFGIEDSDLEGDEGLETAVLLSLFTDRRAEEGDVLPDGGVDRRGWWADAHPAVADDKFGSRLWLLDCSKETQDVQDRAEEYAREALQWMIDDRVASRVDVLARIPRSGMLGIEVTIHRPFIDAVTYRYNSTWDAQAARGA
jgi:phage gp46-like protein